MSWRCPKCHSLHLNINVMESVRLLQFDDDTYQTESTSGDHEWDDNSPMFCRDCGYNDIVKNFEVTIPEPTLIDEAKQVLAGLDDEEQRAIFFKLCEAAGITQDELLH